MKHPTLTPAQVTRKTLAKLQPVYAEYPGSYLCLCLNSMTLTGEITEEEREDACDFIEAAIYPHYSYMAWLNKHNPALYDQAYEMPELRKALRTEWLNSILKEHDAETAHKTTA